MRSECRVKCVSLKIERNTNRFYFRFSFEFVFKGNNESVNFNFNTVDRAFVLRIFIERFSARFCKRLLGSTVTAKVELQ